MSTEGGDPRAVRVSVPRRVLDRIGRQAEEAYPREACGFLVGSEAPDSPSELRRARMSGRTSERYGRLPATSSPARGGAPGPGARVVLHVEAAEAAVNRAERPDRFLIDARQVLEALRRTRAAGRRLLGVYHSHPDGTAGPSETDADDAWGEWLYLIVPCRGGRAGEARAWCWSGAGFTPVPVDDDARVPSAAAGGKGSSASAGGQSRCEGDGGGSRTPDGGGGGR